MVEQLIPKKFDFDNIEGLSEKQLSTHYGLYLGYINKTNEIWRRLQFANIKEANATYSTYRCLKTSETYALNGAKLHQLYFSNLGKCENPSPLFLNMVCRDFGSLKSWEEDIKACGISSRGWAITALDLDDCKIRNYLCDAHNKGNVDRAMPILVMDVYEHAYYIDYGSDKKKYIEVFFKNINWKEVNHRLENYCLTWPYQGFDYKYTWQYN